MNVSFVNYDPFEQPVLILKTAHGDTIGVIGSAENVGIDINYNEVSTIEFDITDRINGEVMPYYDQAVGMRIVELVDIGQFILMNPDEVDTGELRRKKCKCNSLEYEFTYKKITLPENTYRLWDPSGKEITVVSMIMEQMPSWRVEFVSESLQYAYRTFSVSNDNLYNFIKGTVQQSFGCVFEFDTFARTVRIIDVNADAETRPVLISHENLAKEIDIKENTDNLFTRLDVNGADGVDIRSVNPAGTNKLINLDYFMTKDNFSTALINKYNQWKQSWKNNITPYRYLTIRHSAAVMQKITEQSALLDLKNELTDVENEQAVIIQAIASGLKTQADLDGVNVRVRSKKEEIAAKENEIKNIERQIEDIISEMKAVQNQCSFEAHFTADEMAILTPYIRDGEISESSFVVTDNTSYTSTGSGKWADDLTISIKGSVTRMTDSSSGSEIYDIRGGSISIGSNMTGSIVSAIADIKADGSVVMSIRIGAGSVDGDTFDGASITIVGSLYSNTNDAVQSDDTGDYNISEIEFAIRDAYEYFTLDVSEYDKRSVSQDLMEYGIDVLERLAWPKYSFSVSLANFFAIKDFVYFKNQLRLGAKIDLVAGEGKALSPICTGISMNYNNPSSLTMRFGDTYSANDSKFSLLDLLEKSVSMGKNVDVGKFNYSSFVNSGAKTNIKKFMESALDVAKNAILSSGRQAITWDGAGFRLRKWANDDKTAYDDEQIWMNNNSIMLTDNNWNTAKMAIGKFKDANLGDCWGVVAPMIVGTLIAGSELVIESAKKDGGTSVFRVDGDGCRLYNSQFDVHNETAHIAINPYIGIAVGKQSVYKDGDPTKLDENNANFWVDTDGNIHMRGTLHGASGEFTGRVVATELIIQSSNNRNYTIDDYISEVAPDYTIGGTNLLIGTKELKIGTTADDWRVTSDKVTRYGNESGFYRLKLTDSGQTADTWTSAQSPLKRLPDGWYGKEVTLTAWIWSENWAAVDAGIAWTLCLSQGDAARLNYGSKYSIVVPGKAELGADAKSDTTLANSKWVRVSTTFTLDAAGVGKGSGVLHANTHIFAQFFLRRNGEYRIYAPMMEFGNIASDWSPAPEDTDSELGAVRSELSVQADKIDTKVSRYDENGKLISYATTEWTEDHIKDLVYDEETGLQTQINRSADEILLLAGRTIGGTQLLKESRTLLNTHEEWTADKLWNAGNVEKMTNGFSKATLSASGLTADSYKGFRSPLTRLPDGWRGRQVTVSALVYSDSWETMEAGGQSPVTWTLCLSKGGTQRLNWRSKYSIVKSGTAIVGSDAKGTLKSGAWTRISVTWTLDESEMNGGTGVFDDNTHIFVEFFLRRNGSYSISAPKMEFGSEATDWSAHEEDIENALLAEIKVTQQSIMLAVDGKANKGELDTGEDGGVHAVITKDKFSVDVPGENGDFELNKTGAKVPVLVSNDITAPNVTPRYMGANTLYVDPNATSAQIAAGNYFRSLSDVLTGLNGKWLPYTVTIVMAAGAEEQGTLQVRGMAGNGQIIINGNGAKLTGQMEVHLMAVPVTFDRLNVDVPANGCGYHIANGSAYAQIKNCIINGRGSGWGVRSAQGSQATVNGCELYGLTRSLYTQNSGRLHGENNKGDCVAASASGGYMSLTGTQPCHQSTWTAYKAGAGQVFTEDVTVDMGTVTPPPPAEPVTAKFLMLHADTYAGGYENSWDYQKHDDIMQGYTEHAGRIFGCIWFDTAKMKSDIGTKTIKKASLQLTAQKYVGRGVSVEVHLWGTATQYAGRSGAPELTVDYGVIGRAAPGETTTITIPAQAVADIVSSHINALMLYSDDTKLYEDRNFSRNYMRFDGGTKGDASTRPVLTVVYE